MDVWLLFWLLMLAIAAGMTAAGWLIYWRRASAQLAVQCRLAAQLSGALAFEDIVEPVLTILCQCDNWQTATIFRTGEAGSLRCMGVWSRLAGRHEEFIDASRNLSFMPGIGLPTAVLLSAKVTLHRTLKTEFPRAGAADRCGLRSALLFPLIGGGQVLGVCELFSEIPPPLFGLPLEFYETLGRLLGAFIGREQRQERLTESERQLHAVVDTAVDGIVWVDADGAIENVNKGATRLLGYAESDMIGKNVVEFLPEHYQRKFGSALTHYFHRTAEGLVGRVTQVFGQRKDGSTLPMEIAVSRLSIGPREIFIATIRDISDRKLMEKRVAEFYSTVSHELRSPLASIRGSLGLIEGGAIGDVPDEVRELVQIAKRNCDRLIRLINDILDAKKIEAGKLPVKKAAVRPDELIFAGVEGMQSVAAEARVSLVAQAESEPLVFADTDRVVQVLTNLLSNAIKYSAAGGQVDVFVSPAINGDKYLRFSVRDRGPGIASEHLDKLFSHFQQLDSSDSRRHGGTGLGLAISKSIVEQLDGQIGVDNAPGEGATFWFELPIFEPRFTTVKPESHTQPEMLGVLQDPLDR